MKMMLTVLALVIAPFSNAASYDLFECEVVQVTRIDETGNQRTAQDKLTKEHLLGASFFVNRESGVITGKFISNDRYKNQVLADGRTRKNPLSIVSHYVTNKEHGANATYFLVVNTHIAGDGKTFFLKGMNGELMSGTCK